MVLSNSLSLLVDNCFDFDFLLLADFDLKEHRESNILLVNIHTKKMVASSTRRCSIAFIFPLVDCRSRKRDSSESLLLDLLVVSELSEVLLLTLASMSISSHRHYVNQHQSATQMRALLLEAWERNEAVRSKQHSY